MAHVFNNKLEREGNDEFLDRLRLPSASRRDNDSAWEPKLAPRPKVVAIRDESPSSAEELRRLEQTIAEMSAQIGELTIVVDELRETLAGFGEDLPPARWRIPLRASKR